MKPLRIHHLQHVSFEGLGSINEWITANGVLHTATHMYNNETLPEIDDFDALIIMGGPMSVNDEDTIAWLKPEKELIKKAIENNKPVLGICLGAQLIAHALNAKVYPNKEKEIGYFPVRSVFDITSENGRRYLFARLLNEAVVLHWHGETFDLPANAIHLVQSEACLYQTFLYKENVLGLQFHIEMNAASVKDIISNCSHELVSADHIQSAVEITAGILQHTEQNKRILFEILDNMFKVGQ